MSLDWNESFDAEYKTPFHIAITILLPLTLFHLY